MESRTRLTVGGIATVAASVAVVSMVLLTNSVALADSAGSSAGTSSIVVPSPSASPTASRTVAPVVPSETAETVPAPEPETVTVPEPVQPSDDSATDVEPAEPVAPDADKDHSTWQLKRWQRDDDHRSHRHDETDDTSGNEHPDSTPEWKRDRTKESSPPD